MIIYSYIKKRLLSRCLSFFLLPRLHQEGFDLGADLIPDPAEDGQPFLFAAFRHGRVVKPKMSPLNSAEEKRTGLVGGVAERDHKIKRLAGEFIHALAAGCALVYADLLENSDGQWMRRLWVCAGRICLEMVPQIIVHQSLGHLRPSAVGCADKQDSLLHFLALFFSSSSARAKAGQKGSTRGCSSGRSLPCSTRMIPLLSGMISPTPDAGT